jgi:hypothetical protein
MAKNKNIGRTELSLTSIHEDLTFSSTDVWVWVRVPETQYEFLDDESRERLASDMDVALANLVTSDEKGVECHMIVSSYPFDSVKWVQELDKVSQSNNPNPYHTDYLYDMYSHVDYQEFREKLVLLGINIGKRISYSPAKSLTPGTFDKIINLLSAAPVSDYITPKELEYWQARARSVSSALQTSRIHALKAETKEIAYAVRKNFYPAMPTPTPEELALGQGTTWGEGEVASLVDAQIENHPKFLKITQEVDNRPMVGYRATLCFSKFPTVMDFPRWNPWIHYSSALPFSTDFSLRFTLEPARKVRKEVDHKLKEALDQANNMTSAGGTTTIEVDEHINLGNQLEYSLKQDATPWVFGRFRVTVEAETEIELRERVARVIDHYRSMDIFVTWPTGDQLSLLKENLPNDKVRVLSYYQRQTLGIISTGMPSGSGTAGDRIKIEPERELGWIGNYLGYTTGSIRQPVFLSLHSTIDTNNSPGCVITGSPGNGKTFAALTITQHMAYEGTWVIYIDPKGDALGMQALPGLKDATVLDLQDGNDGILDPFSIGKDIAQQRALAIETLTLFVGGQMSHEQNIALSRVVEDVSNYPNPSLNNVVDYLIRSSDTQAQSLGSTLNLIRQLPYARLCFSANKGTTIKADSGLTIITLQGLDLPNTANSDTHTKANQLAVAVMFLLTSFTRQLMFSANQRHPKAIVIDEAWAITSTPQGKKLVSEVARMGRARNTALLLISQNAKDFLGETVTNSVSTRIAFKAESHEEVTNVLEFLELEDSEANREEVKNLQTGECLIKDWSRRIARVQIDSWNKQSADAFETNPRKKNQTNR